MRYRNVVATVVLTLAAAAAALAEKPANQKPLLLDPMQQIDIRVENWLRSLPAAPADVEGVRSRLTPTGLGVTTMATGYYKCFPTCTENDGRMLSIAGDALATLVGTDKAFKVVLPKGASGLEIGVYDGDTGGTWDFPGTVTAAQLHFELYTDPDADGIGDTLVLSTSGAAMSDVGWSTVTAPVDASSQSPSGSHRWVLKVGLTNLPAPGVMSNFKLRSNGAILVAPEPFAFTAPLFGPAEGYILYPNAGSGDFTTTTYDGTWTFHLDVGEGFNALEIWDGDFDRGSWDGTDLDTDDPDTDGVPSFDSGSARPEGLAWTSGCATEASDTGCPADNRSAGVFLREPAVRYEVICPAGATSANDNPSGNQEWELFSIGCPASAAGTATVQLYGTDLSNLNALRFPVDALCVDDLGRVCDVDRPYLIGDTVFRDCDGDGVQDGAAMSAFGVQSASAHDEIACVCEEKGIMGVLVIHVTTAGKTVASAYTDANGKYSFDVEAGTHKVVVDSSNFNTGKPLSGLVSTTGGNSQTRPVIDQNNLDFDFGYGTPTSGGQGCTPGYWKQSQHFDSWEVYKRTDRYEIIFSVPYVKSLLQALGAGGGGAQALGRHAAAGLLNAANSGVNYKFTVAEVISLVQNAYSTHNYDSAKNILENENESGCPLN